MYHKDHEKFIAAIHGRNKIRLTFFSKEDDGNLTRLCSPMDFGPFKSAKTPVDRYHLWDHESDKKAHNLALLPENIITMDFLEETFDPSKFVNWNCNWLINRDWGIYS